MYYFKNQHTIPVSNTISKLTSKLPKELYIRNLMYQNCMRIHEITNYWASEVSPTLGCSIEISRDIHAYICMYVCMYVGMSSIVYGKTIQKNRMLKCVGRIT